MTNKNKPLLMEVNRIFVTVNYDYSQGFDHREFYKAVILTLNRCASIDDASVIIDLVLHFQTLHNDFVELLQDGECVKFFLQLKLLPYKVNLIDEVNPNTNIVTNALTPDYRRYYVLNPLIKENHICYVSKFKSVKTYSYYGKLEKKFFEVYDKNERHLFSLTIKGNVLKLIDNDCNAAMSRNKKNVNVYHRSDLNEHKKEKGDKTRLSLASYKYKKIKHINKLGLVRYTVNDENADKELLDLIAIGYLVLARN